MKVNIREIFDTKCKNCGKDFCTCEEEIALYNAGLNKCSHCGIPEYEGEKHEHIYGNSGARGWQADFDIENYGALEYREEFIREQNRRNTVRVIRDSIRDRLTRIHRRT